MTYRLIVPSAVELKVGSMALDWSRRRSAEQAGRWLERLDAVLATLITSPERWPLAPEASDFGYEMRQLNFGIGRKPTHRVLYRIVGDCVEVVGVRHLAQQDLRPGDL